MTLQQLRYLIEVAKQGSINKAAKSLFISQPSLSHAISELEREINITLFDRTSKGVSLSDAGAEFYLYAQQVVKQAEILEDRFIVKESDRQRFCVSTQHYAVGVLSFCELIRLHGSDAYDFRFRETKVLEIIEDVKSDRSEVGIVYLNRINEEPLKRQFVTEGLAFEELFEAVPKILVSKDSPLAKRTKVTLDDLCDYPYLSFEQDESNIFSFSDEVLSTMINQKSVKVTERATLVTMVCELNGYAISTGIISDRLRRTGIVPIELEVDSQVKVGILTSKARPKSDLCDTFLKILRRRAEET